MEDNKEDYYILCGWMAEDDVEKFLEEVKDDDKVFVVVEDDHDAYFGEPPTKLENPKLFRPFEMFVQMYGLPSHNEMDPTVFVGVTYSFIFGVMFGDVGQGCCSSLAVRLSTTLRRLPWRESSHRRVFSPLYSDFCLAVSSDLRMYFRAVDTAHRPYDHTAVPW